MHNHSTIICKQCEKEFNPSRKEQRFCSNHCSALSKANKTRRTDRPKCICEICEKEFIQKTNSHSGRFCSKTCVVKNMNAKKNASIWVTKTCPECGQVFTHRQETRDRIFCSTRCSTLHHHQSSARKKPLVTVQCEQCGKLKDIRTKALKRFRFCSRMCRHDWVLQNMPRISSIETKIAEAFERADMKPEAQYLIGPFTTDFAFVEQKLAVECDGDYWHKLPDVQKRDRMKNHYFWKNGWNILRLWEHEINASPADCVERVRAKLQSIIS